MEEKLENTEQKTENAEARSECADAEPGDTVKTSQSEEEKTAHAEEKTENTEEVPMHAGETTAEKASPKDVGKRWTGKSKISREKIVGSVELAAAFILAALSGWLFINTRGTRLLYVSVTTGRVSRYYWIFLAVAVIFLAIGVFTLRFRHKKEKGNKENLSAREKKVIEEN